jgi:hypothetical protein
MSEWENNTGESDEWYTPSSIFEALKVEFDLDPCSPSYHHWVPAMVSYVKADDGLKLPWFGSVFMNPPFGDRLGQVPWLEKFFAHGDGIAIVRAYTSANWFHDQMSKAELMLFPRGKTKFVRPDGTIGDRPGSGVVLAAMGEPCCGALARCGLGMVWDRRG